MTAAIQLYPYQQSWFLDRARFKIGMFARQTGKTFTTTLELVDDCFETEASGGRTRWVILSRGERQAKEAMVEGVKKHCSAYRMAAREMESYYRAESGERYTMLEVELPGGSRITPCRPMPTRPVGLRLTFFWMSSPSMPTVAKSGPLCFRSFPTATDCV